MSENWYDALDLATWQQTIRHAGEWSLAVHRRRRVTLDRIGENWQVRWHPAGASDSVAWESAIFDALDAALVAAEIVTATPRDTPL